MKDVLEKLLSNGKEKEGKLGIYFLGAVVCVCLVFALSMLTGCGKDEKNKRTDSQIEMFEVKTKVRFMPDGLSYQSVDVTFYIDDNDLDEKQINYCERIFKENYALSDAEWQALLKDGEITISTRRD